MKIELLTNAQVAALIGTGNKSYTIVDLLTGSEWAVSFAGARADHYDVTPTTQKDMEQMLFAIGGIAGMRTNGWVARPVAVKIGNRLVAGGLNTRMHHIRIGGGNPGPDFPSRNENGPPWTEWGGHCCLYFSNSVGGAGGMDSSNRHARPEANRLANVPRANGRQARAACIEAHMRGAGSAVPATPKSVNYRVRVTGDNVNVRTGPGTQHKSVKKVHKGEPLHIVRESDGIGASRWGQINGDKKELCGCWIALDFTVRDSGATTAPSPVPAPKTYRVQVGDTLSQIAARFGVDIDELVRLNNIVDRDKIKAGDTLRLRS